MGKIRKRDLYKIILQVLTFAFRVKVLRFVFKNVKSAFDVFKKVFKRRIENLPDILDGPQVT